MKKTKIHKCNGLQPLASKISVRKHENDGLIIGKPNNDVNYLSNIMQKSNGNISNNYTQSQMIIPYNNNTSTNQSVTSLNPSIYNDLNRTSQSCPTISENGMIFQPLNSTTPHDYNTNTMQHTQSAPILQRDGGKTNVQFYGHLPYNNYSSSNYSNDHVTSTSKFNNSVQKSNGVTANTPYKNTVGMIEHIAEPNMWQPTVSNWLSYPNNIQNKKISFVGNNSVPPMSFPQIGDNNTNPCHFNMNTSSINNNSNNNNNGTMTPYNQNNSMNSMIGNISSLQDNIGYNTTNMFTPSMNEAQYNGNKNNTQQCQHQHPLNTRFNQCVMSLPGYNFGEWSGLMNGAYPTYGAQGGGNYRYGGRNNTVTGYNMDNGISLGMYGMNGGSMPGISCHTMSDPGLGVLYGSGVPNVPFVPQDYCPQFLNDLQYYGNLGGSQVFPGPM